MSDYLSTKKNEPTFKQILGEVKTSLSSQINCHNVGRIIEFNSLNQTCTVELMQIKQFNGKPYTPAPITQVPLIIYGGGSGHITLPDPVGTYCLLFFLDRNTDNFFITGEQYTPSTTRMHDFTDCIAITTFKTLANPLSDYDSLAVSILNDIVISDIQYKTYLKTYGNSIQAKVSATDQLNVTTESNIVANSSSITLAAGGGGEVAIGQKLTLKNTTQNLGVLINTFLVACEAITTVNGGALTSTSKKKFTDLKPLFEELLNNV